jgi:hypothetical protein
MAPSCLAAIVTGLLTNWASLTNRGGHGMAPSCLAAVVTGLLLTFTTTFPVPGF